MWIPQSAMPRWGKESPCFRAIVGLKWKTSLDNSGFPGFIFFREFIAVDTCMDSIMHPETPMTFAHFAIKVAAAHMIA